MKRIAILLAALLLLSACNGNQGAEETSGPQPDSPTGPSGAPAGAPAGVPTDGATPFYTPPDLELIEIDLGLYPDYYVYPGETEDSISLAVDENGVAYIYTYAYDKTSQQNIQTISTYDLDGEKTSEYSFHDGLVTAICAGNGMLYMLVFYSAELYTLYSYDHKTQEAKYLKSIDRFASWQSAEAVSEFATPPIKSMAYSNGRVYILGMDSEWDGDNKAAPMSSYKYYGTVLAAYDLADKSLEVIFHEEPQRFAVTPGGKLIILAHDPEGYYYMELDPETMTAGERIYQGQTVTSNSTYNFASDGLGVIYPQSPSLVSSTASLKYMPLTDDAVVVEMLTGASIHRDSSDVIYRSGFTFYNTVRYDAPTETFVQSVIRVKNSAYINETHPIQLIQSTLDRGPDLSADGYDVQAAELTSQEFALAVLSRGADYDLAYVNSRQDFSYNLRDKGSFYPLNDVPGVREYLDACFPYIRDAATGKDGNIWMLPVCTDLSPIVYNEANCKKAGVSFAGAATVGDVISNVRKASEYDASRSNHKLNPYSVLQRGVITYLRTNTVLETPEFRRMAPMLKDLVSEWAGADLSSYPFFTYGEDGLTIVNPDFLFDTDDLNASHYIERDDLRAVPVTGTGAPAPVYCMFLCVNPDSGNLGHTLDYISALCEKMTERKDSFMLADRSTYTRSDYAASLYSLYETAVIDFNVSDEVFTDDFNKYLSGQITLDQLIKEAGRKLAMYLGE